MAKQNVLFMHAAPSRVVRATVIDFLVFLAAYMYDAITSEALDASGARINDT